MIARDNQTIVAQCTPQGSGALALIRISGDDAFDSAARMIKLSSNNSLHDCATHTIHYGSVRGVGDEIIDRVMVLLMRAPKTFTGQDTIEITCHNNQFLIERIIQRAIVCGARYAQSGEFSKRAFLNGKIDLVQAEAINELIHAGHQYALKQSLAQLDGSFSHWLSMLEKRLLTCHALCQASFEFIEEDEIEFGDQINEHIDTVLHEITSIQKTFDQQQRIREGIRIAFIGAANAGKSSLFNVLLQQPRAIVTAIPGTTRDSLEAGIFHDGMYWTLVDTAGLRDTDELIEQEGIRRSFKQAHTSDIIVLMYDCSRKMTSEERIWYLDILQKYGQKVILVAHKSDLEQCAQEPLSSQVIIETSVENMSSIHRLHDEIRKKVNALFSTIESPFLLNQRHYNLLLEVEKKLHDMKILCKKPIPYELLSCHLSEALQSLTELTGKTISEQSMNEVFKNFCVGK